MKKIISLTAAVFLFVVCFMTGCDMVENGEKAVERSVQKVEDGASALMNDGNAMLNEGENMLQGNANKDGSGLSDEEKSKFIGEEKAKEIALKKADVTTENVIFDKIELDYDDGLWQYEVDFKKDTTEYDAKINAVDGSVVKWEVENK